MRMRNTVVIDDELLAEARELSGLREKTAVLHAGLRALIARERAAAPRGLKPIRRRRPTRGYLTTFSCGRRTPSSSAVLGRDGGSGPRSCSENTIPSPVSRA